MALLNLYLTTGQKLTKEQLQSVHAKWTQKQLIAVEVVLSNLVRYQKGKVLFESRHRANTLKQYNPLEVGHYAMLGAIEKLKDSKHINFTLGTHNYQKGKTVTPKLSEISLTSKGEKLCESLNITPSTVSRVREERHLLLKSPGSEGKIIEYIEDDYSRFTEQQMVEYNDMLNEHLITDNDKTYHQPFISRTYRDIDGSKLLKYGGRSGGHWHQLSKKKRDQIKIDGKKTTKCDYTSSVINILYLIETRKMLGRGVDGYEVEGYPRDLVKIMVNRMLNNSSKQAATMAYKRWLRNEATEKDKETSKKIVPLRLQNKILETHPLIASYFYRGKDFGQRVSWVEANVVFTIAQQLTLIGVPVLTVHDEFICKEEDEEIVWEMMYSTYVEYVKLES